MSSCYRSSLDLARKHSLASIAFPAISTGIYGFPVDRATGVAVRTVRDELRAPGSLRRVVFVCFDDRTAAIYARTLAEAPQSR